MGERKIENVVKIMRGRENREVAKVMFTSEREKDRVWTRKEELRRKFNMFLDE